MDVHEKLSLVAIFMATLMSCPALQRILEEVKLGSNCCGHHCCQTSLLPLAVNIATGFVHHLHHFKHAFLILRNKKKLFLLLQFSKLG